MPRNKPPPAIRRLWPRLTLSVRFMLPLLLIFALLATVVLPQIDAWTMRWSIRDIERQSQIIADTLHEPIIDLIENKDTPKLMSLLNNAVKDRQLYALALCTPSGKIIARTETFPASLGCTPTRDEHGRAEAAQLGPFGRIHIAIKPMMSDTETVASLILMHDLSYVEGRVNETRNYVIAAFIVLAFTVMTTTLGVAHLSWRNWVSGVSAVLRGENPLRSFATASPEVRGLMTDLSQRIKDADRSRNIRDDLSVQWRPESLRRLLHDQLYGDEVLVVSHREPYIHVRTGHGIEVKRPASGLVTAVEPVMQACSGTWIAHGTGNADRELVDENDRIRVPPGQPGYTLRRIWLSEEEERGFYYGFANEGLWPLCHIAHVRPSFRASDWDSYLRVNQRFAEAVAEEANTRDPVILVQDYHFALLPKMIHEILPRATILTFWHIPWPNPEAFSICPWRNEILEGLLGSTILGFHTPYHRKNFMETVDRFLEARIEHENSLISYRGELTMVQDYPISIHWPGHDSDNGAAASAAREVLRERLGLDDGDRLIVGVDRLDYTKGIIERFEAIERLFETQPQWLERLHMLQIAAPSRMELVEYRDFEERVLTVTQRINERFGTADWQPIQLLVEQHSSQSVIEHYRAADVCMVTSLHDGMNLVAKEFVAARDDELGVLILSQFAGAAGELRESLIVNPYDREEIAHALQLALTMTPAEQRERMRSMRTLVRDNNIYRWAARMLLDAATVRQQARVRERIFRHRSQYSRGWT